MKALAVALALVIGSGAAHAEKDYVPWYKGKYGNNRILHLSLTGGMALLWVTQEFILKDTLSPSDCRWCTPPGFDKSARNAIVWNDVKRADFLSSMDAYVLAPVVGVTLLYFSDKDASWGRLIDDILPVAETVAASQLIVVVAKIAIARQRPYVYFGNTKVMGGNEDNLSFPSGHSSLGFAITASAGMICHWRHYWTEPYVWGTGVALSLSVEYLRMAADKHWMTDVLTGGFVGIGAGLLIPRLMRRDIKIAPVPGGAAVVGQF